MTARQRRALAERIDQLGLLKAQAADIEKAKKGASEAVRRAMLAQGVESAEGELFRATLSVAERITLDTKAAKDLLPIDQHPELYRSAAIETLDITARIGDVAIPQAKEAA